MSSTSPAVSAFGIEMKLLGEIIDSLPGGPRVEEIQIGPFDTAVKCLKWGLSSTFRDPCSGPSPAWVRGAGSLVGRPGLEVASLASSDRLLEASVGMAAINSLLEIGDLEFHEVNAARIVVEKGKSKEVAVVGNFPFLEKFRPKVGRLRVINKSPERGDEGVEEAREILPHSDVVAITASSFLNHTIEELLALCPRAYTLVLGPTAPLSPVLFNYGVDAVSGALIAEPDRALPFIREGSSFRRIEGLKLVTIFKGG